MQRFRLLLLCASTLIVVCAINTSKPCNYQRIGDGVCVCNITYCDTLDVLQPNCGEFTLVTSSKSGKRFKITNRTSVNVSQVAVPLNRWLKIDANQTYQKIIGFGGAFTDATSSVIAAMHESLRICVYTSYVSSTNGAAYQIFRIPLGGSDFSDTPWAYNEQPEMDVMLSNMTILHPLDQRRADQIKELTTVIPASKLKFMLCAWSPPPWMKSNQHWHGLSYLPTQFYSTWALYHVKALQLWQNEGINIWSISTGNEPITAAIVPFMSLGWTARDQRQWIFNHLKPQLQENGFDDVLIIGFDDQRPSLALYCLAFQRNLFDSHIDDLDMIGVHWYLDALSDVNLLDTIATRNQLPILYTESCTGSGTNLLDLSRGPKLGSWTRCREYVQRIIQLLNHGISGFVDWNLILDMDGGPNYAHNFVDAPMIFDQHNQTLYKQPMFYGIAHLSKFLSSDCTRIDSKLSLISSIHIDAIAFTCTNHTKVIVLHNRNTADERITVIDNNITKINLILDASSVNTLLYRDC